VPEILRGSEPRFEDMVRYMESASEGLAHHFAVEDDELRLKTNIGVVRFRRVSPVAPRRRESPVTEPTAGSEFCRGEPLFVPHSGHSPSSARRLEAAFNETPT
jgi:hypothetical protein